MASPRIIEFLLSLRRKGNGGPLITMGQTQVIIDIFPPGQIVTIASYPRQGDYMDILYSWAFDPANVPNAFYAWGSYFGARIWEGVAHSWWMHNNSDGFVFITEAEPAYAMIFNRSPLAQYYGATSSHLSIKSAEDFEEMYKQITLMSTSKESVTLATEANSILGEIRDKGGR